MKRILTLIVAIAFVATASAQTLMTADFEDGTLGKWQAWENKADHVKITEKGKDNSKALSYRTGTFVAFFGVKADETYKVTFDSSQVWGKTAGYVQIQFYNKDAGKLELIAKADVPTGKEFKQVEFTFKGKMPAMHRITFAPGGNGGEFIVDNIKIEKVN